ncbi:tetratricopeptide (TPR) repeat protein [Nakamurella sp. UYEF19]|uniref:CHAT domain-containing protein n=1 Tax=Nakamurella sp. UYEF19 TaxID=1756392 RepID=UPI00339400ED
MSRDGVQESTGNGTGHVDILRPAVSLLEKARAAGDAGHPLSALRYCERALKSISALGIGSSDVSELSCLVLITQAYQHSALGDVKTALAVLELAEQHDASMQAAIWGARAMSLMRSGDDAAALRAFDHVIGAADTDPRVLSAALLNRGWLHMGGGRLSPARSDTQGALDAATTAGDNWGAFMAAHNLGYLQFLSGDLPGALESMELAQRSVDDPPVGMPALDRARVLLVAGLIREASEFSRLAVEDFDRNKALSELPDALAVAAETDLLRGDWRSALTRARRAKTLNIKRGNDNAAMLAELVELKAEAGRRSGGRSHRPAPAERDARRAAELAHGLVAADLSTDAVTAHLLAAEALLETDDVDGARTQAQHAGKLGRDVPMGVRLHARLVSARLDLRQQDHVRGFAHIRRGLDELADFQARFGSQDMQSGASIHGAALARLGLRTAVDSGSAALILQWLERSRAVTTRLPAVHPPADAELADTLGELRLATIDARAAAVAGHRDAVLERRVADLRNHVRSRSWTVSGSGTVQRPLTLAAVQRLLAVDPSDPTVVALLHGDRETHVLVITARRAVHRPLIDWPSLHARIRRTSADLDLLAAPRIPTPMMAVAQQSLAADLAHLGHHLLEPILPLLTGGPVIVAAVGPLATLPWGLLPQFVGRPVSVSSSVTVAMSAGGRPSRAYLRGVLAVAGPDVPGGADEATTIASMHPGAGLLVGAEATGEALLGQLPQGGLLHIAAHGHHETDSPLFSSVQLMDGPLYGYDIAPNPTLPDHVVLSSCDVGRSDDRPGGEPLGLAAALLRSGVSTVVAGVSRISDQVAASTMVVYHERLLAGDGPAVALADAISRAEGAPAPLTCFGAGS